MKLIKLKDNDDIANYTIIDITKKTMTIDVDKIVWKMMTLSAKSYGMMIIMTQKQ